MSFIQDLKMILPPEKKVLAAASPDFQKYYLAEEFSDLPKNIQDAVRIICVVMAQKLSCVFLMGFQEDGDIYFETLMTDVIANFDDIGAELEIKRLKKEKAKLWKALRLWYVIYRTREGERLKQELIEREKSMKRMLDD